MSVCFVSDGSGNAVQVQDEGSAGGAGDDGASAGVEDGGIEGGDMHQALEHFWEWIMEDIRRVGPESFKNQVLPLARVKKIMKLDEEVKMISAEAPLLFAKAAEIFIHELTLRAWAHTEDNKRRTLQRNDIAMAIIKSDQFDFLIDIVPRQELKPAKAKEDSRAGNTAAVPQDQVHYYFQLAQQHQAALQTGAGTGAGGGTTTVQGVSAGVQSAGQQATTQAAPAPAQPMHAVQLVQQVVTPNGEIQQIPIQLSAGQMNMLRMQAQGGGGQPILIQTAPVNTQQHHLIQVQPSQAQQLFLTVASQENE